MLARLDELTAARESFAIETTLSGRAYASWLRRCLAGGYRVHLVFLWLPSADVSIERVARRVQAGGHGIPEDVIRRRYPLGIKNFLRLYSPLASSWELYASVDQPPRLIARGQALEVIDRTTWSRIQRQAEGDV